MKCYLLHIFPRIIVLVSLGCLLPDLSYSQSRTFYSPFYGKSTKTEIQLRVLLSNSKPDTNRVIWMVAMADYYLRKPGELKGDLDTSGLYLKKAYHLAALLKSERWKHNILMEYGQFYAEADELKKQKDIYLLAINAARKTGDKQLEADAWFYFACNAPTENDGGVQQNIARATKALQLYREIKNKLAEVLTIKVIADFHFQLGDYDLAEKELLYVLSEYQSISYPEIYYTYDLLSALYNRKGDLSKALYYSLYTVKFCQQAHEKVPGIFMRRVAEAYHAIGKRKESIIWFGRAFRYYADRNDLFCFYILSEQTREMVADNNALNALELIKATLKRFPNPEGDKLLYTKIAFAKCYTALGKFKLAAHYYDPLIKKLSAEPRVDETNTLILFDVGQYYFVQKDYAKARYYLNRAATAKVFITLPMLISLNKMLFDMDMAYKEPENAIVHLQEFHKLQDYLFGQEKMNTIERLQIEFNASQTKNENELLRRKSQLQLQELGRAQLIKKTTLGGIAFLSLVIILLYSRFSLKKRVHKILLEQKKRIDMAYADLEVSIAQKNKLIEEKECLIREVHHRVKNNLQLTMSLLNSQSHYLQDASAVAAIRESHHRLKSIALIHQKLYQTDNVANININSYIAELINYLRDSFNDARHINFELNVLDLDMDVAQAVPLGLFINEAITNIFKYAFPEPSSGMVKINLRHCSGDTYKLQICDNGIGLPDNFDYREGRTMGMTLMKGLSEQLDGEFLIESNNGLSISLIFENHTSSAGSFIE